MNTKLAKMMKVAMLVALSVVGAFMKIPSPAGSVALDAIPGYFGAIVIGRKEGALIAGLGHMASAATGGFILTVPIHLYIALQMAVSVYLFGFVKEKFGYVAAVIVGVILNGIVAPALFIPLPGFGKAFFVAMLLPLFVGSVINVIIAAVISKRFVKLELNNVGKKI